MIIKQGMTIYSIKDSVSNGIAMSREKCNPVIIKIFISSNDLKEKVISHIGLYTDKKIFKSKRKAISYLKKAQSDANDIFNSEFSRGE